MKQKPVAFIQALSIVGAEPKKAKNYLTDKRLTYLEKCILKSVLLLRDHQFEEIIKLLSNQVSSDPFIESQRLFTLGNTYNNMSNFKQAIHYFEAYLSIGMVYKIDRKEFHAAHCLFTLNHNIQSSKEMKKYYRRMKTMTKGSDFETICILSAQYALHRLDAKLDEASDVIHEIELMMESMTEYQVVNFLIDKFDIQLCLRQYDECKETLQFMKTFRKFRSSANYNFMNSLLEHLADDSPLYVYSQEYKDYPVLHDQMMIIKNLQEDLWDEAESLWNKLEAAFPHLYGKNFSYQGAECIFSLCLKKHLNLRKNPVLKIEGKGKEEALIEILRMAASPVSIERVFQMVYGKPSESKEDFIKLRTLIYAVKKKKGLKISYKKGCYQIAS